MCLQYIEILCLFDLFGEISYENISFCRWAGTLAHLCEGPAASCKCYYNFWYSVQIYWTSGLNNKMKSLRKQFLVMVHHCILFCFLPVFWFETIRQYTLSRIFTSYFQPVLSSYLLTVNFSIWTFWILTKWLLLSRCWTLSPGNQYLEFLLT